MGKIKGTLKSGFAFEVDDDVFDDYDLVLLFGQYQENPSMILFDKIADKFIGAEQKKALMDHLRDENGKLRTSAMIDALAEIEDATTASKNSEPSPT